MLFSTLLISLLATAAHAQDCVSGNSVHIFIARGTTEKQGSGLQLPIAKAIIARLPGSDIEDVIYPAAFDFPRSVNAGVQNMTSQVKAYHRRCPSSKMVFMGYSQGAQVVGDVVGGGGSVTNNAQTDKTPPLPASVMSKVVSVILYGDPNRDSPRAYNRGSCSVASPQPRSRTGGIIDNYADSIRNFCDGLDPNCCSTGWWPFAHLGYFTAANEREVADFVASRSGVSKVKAMMSRIVRN